MYDHVTEFKEKLVGILSEIQGMGVIDETGTYILAEIPSLATDRLPK